MTIVRVSAMLLSLLFSLQVFAKDGEPKKEGQPVTPPKKTQAPHARRPKPPVKPPTPEPTEPAPEETPAK